MHLRLGLLAAAAALAICLSAPAPAEAKTFRYAFQGDAQSLDPHGLNETFTLGFLGNVYEGLAAYDSNLQLVPGLAVSWKTLSPTKWLFNLRKGVKFHNGDPFTADDVIFSWKRTLTEGSDQKVRGALIRNIVKLDDYPSEVETPSPTPTLVRELVWLYILDKKWAVANNATEAESPKSAETSSRFASLHENGTGPFMIASREPDVKTVFKRAPNYWKKIKSNVDEVVFTPISQNGTRVAALISGELDLAYPIPVQDWARLRSADGVSPLTGPEARTIFLGMDQARDELLYSNVKGKNPFKDLRVRQAFAHAINLEAIKQKVMGGASTPTGLMEIGRASGRERV